MTGSEARKEDRTRTIANGFAVFRPGEPAIHLCCQQICWWWTCECSTVEESLGCVEDGPVIRTLRGGEELPNILCSIASSLGYLHSHCSRVCGPSLQKGHNGSAEGLGKINLRFRESCATKRTASVLFLISLLFVDEENPQYTFAVCAITGGGPNRNSVLQPKREMPFVAQSKATTLDSVKPVQRPADVLLLVRRQCAKSSIGQDERLAVSHNLRLGSICRIL